MSNAASRTCLKCNHVHPGATMSDTEACPKCGAIYSRVEAYVRAEQTRATNRPRSTSPPSQLPAVAPAGRPTNSDFVARMRAKSLYPTFRAMIKIVAWLLYLLAVAAVIGGFASGVGMAMAGAIFGAIFLVIMATAFKEAAMMVADLSDATVLMAARTAPGEDTS